MFSRLQCLLSPRLGGVDVFGGQPSVKGRWGWKSPQKHRKNCSWVLRNQWFCHQFECKMHYFQPELLRKTLKIACGAQITREKRMQHALVARCLHRNANTRKTHHLNSSQKDEIECRPFPKRWEYERDSSRAGHPSQNQLALRTVIHAARCETKTSTCPSVPTLAGTAAVRSVFCHQSLWTMSTVGCRCNCCVSCVFRSFRTKNRQNPQKQHFSGFRSRPPLSPKAT